MASLKSVVIVVVMASGALAGENWPQFRGPDANGHSDAVGLPLKWSGKEAVAWKTPIHDLGWSSPVIWGNQVWLTTAAPGGRQMFAVCVDRSSGRIVHDIKVFDTEKLEHIAVSNSYASPTSAIEAGRLYVHYGTYGTACIDTASGKVLWKRRDLNCDHHEGPGSSLMLWGRLLIFNVDGRDVQYVVALDKATGQTAWKTNRSIDYSKFGINERKAFNTPIIIDLGGRPELISPGAKAVMGYDPATGEERWKVRYKGWSNAPRPVFGQGLLFTITDYERPELWAIRPGGSGDVTESHVAWKLTTGISSMSSLLLIDDLLYMVNAVGIASCMEARTGRQIWKQRLAGTYSASPIYADGRVYFFNDNAVATVIQPGREYKPLAVNELDGEPMRASPAVAGGAIFVRTRTHLYCIKPAGSGSR